MGIIIRIFVKAALRPAGLHAELDLLNVGVLEGLLWSRIHLVGGLHGVQVRISLQIRYTPGHEARLVIIQRIRDALQLLRQSFLPGGHSVALVVPGVNFVDR